MSRSPSSKGPLTYRCAYRTDPSLESRLKVLEEKCQSIPADNEPQARSTVGLSSQSVRRRVTASNGQHNGAQNNLDDDMELQPEDAYGVNLRQDAVDGMGAVLLIDDEEDCGYFGR